MIINAGTYIHYIEKFKYQPTMLTKLKQMFGGTPAEPLPTLSE
jgi:hypothetical protein